MFIEFLLFKQYWKILVITKWSLLHMKDLYRSLAVPTLAEAEVALFSQSSLVIHCRVTLKEVRGFNH